jgi:hypothetical protein
VLKSLNIIISGRARDLFHARIDIDHSNVYDEASSRDGIGPLYPFMMALDLVFFESSEILKSDFALKPPKPLWIQAN